MSFAAGIIAAGEGSRLAASHPDTPKPLVPVAGRPLIHWIVSRFASRGASSILVVHNSRGIAIRSSLQQAFPSTRFDFITADTASSFETFTIACRRLAERAEDFLISTTDAIMPAADVERFWTECRRARADAGLALTRHVDDEKPLWADVDELGLVTAVGADAGSRRQVTCGLYYMTRAAAARLPDAASHPRLRDFWSALVRSGARVAGPLLSKTLDVDRPEDLRSAEAFLMETK